MPVNDELQNEHEFVLRTVRINSFTVTPSSILPFQVAELNWDVRVPEGVFPVRIELRRGRFTISKSRSGSRRVSPVGSTSYSLVASTSRASRVLGSVQLVVDTSDCITQQISEAEIDQQMAAVIDPILAQHHELSRRRPDSVRIEADGLHISVRLKAAIDNVADPDIDIDASVSLRAEAGELKWRMDRYSFDVDFPWWQDVINMQLLPIWLAVALREGNQSSFVRAEISAGLDQSVDQANAIADALNMRFLSVVSRSDRFELTLCPRGE